jgi:hypothetical protein
MIEFSMPHQTRLPINNTKSRLPVLVLAASLLAALLAACDLPLVDFVTLTPTPAPVTTAPGALPEMPDKPTPKQITFQGCPPEGDGGDPALNLLKNRVDEGDYVPVDFDAIVQLPWPESIERRDRKNWPAAETAEVARYEGIPVVVEGFLYNTRLEGPESPNCHGADAEQRDWHVWLIKAPNDDRTGSIVVETTPRIRAQHPGWTVQKMNEAENDDLPARISGWLMLDPEHPDQLGKTRGTIWEIHPITQIELMVDGQWVLLDDMP